VETATASTRFVVGLGNPGEQYARTRHNVGFRVAARLAKLWQASGPRNAFGGLLYDATVFRGRAARRAMLLTPMTYMNRSGQAVREMLTFYKAAATDVLVVLDDMALPPGRLRARAEGSAGGHNGLDDVLAALGTQQVSRLRIGIGSPPGRMDAADFVLSCFTEREAAEIDVTVEQAASAVEDWVFDGIERMMEKYNRKEDSA